MDKNKKKQPTKVIDKSGIKGPVIRDKGSITVII